MPSVRKTQAISVHGRTQPRPDRIDAAADQRARREGKGDRKPDIAEIEQRRMDRETGILQQRIEILALDRRIGDARERSPM